MRIAVSTVAVVVLAAGSASADSEKREPCRDNRGFVSLGANLGVAIPGPAMEESARHENYGSDPSHLIQGGRLAAGLQPVGCLIVGVVGRVQARHEATTRLGENLQTRALTASGLVGFRLGNGWTEAGASLELGAMRSTTTLRGVGLTRTVPAMTGHVEMIFGRGATALEIYWESSLYFSSGSWDDYAIPQLGGMALGVAVHRRF